MAEMFGGGGGRQRGARGQDVRHVLKCTLEEFYSGSTRRLAMTRDVACSTCNGKGTKSGRDPTCGNCRGQGVEVVIQRMGPMMTQMQRPCSKCDGTGRAVEASDRCDGCRGKRSLPEKKVMEVQIDKGMKHGDRVVLRGEAGFSGEPGVPSGDLVFVLESKEHDTYQRAKADLILAQSVPLVDALCGAQIKIQTLDKRTLVVQLNPGEVIKPGSFHCVQGEGMPVRGNPFLKGNMYIKFDVVFPNKVPSELAEPLRGLMGGLPGQRSTFGQAAPSDAIEVGTRPVADIKQELQRRGQEQAQQARGAAYESDSDDDMGGGGQRVQCAQQ